MYRTRWLIGLIGLLVLVACQPGTTSGDVAEPVQEVNDGDGAVVVNEIEPVEETVDEAEPDELVDEVMDDDEAVMDGGGVVILTEDDRPEQLRFLTSSWETDWERHTIDYGDILSGGPPRDGIPSIDDPQFISQAEAEEWLAGNEPVVVVEINGDARAYPIQILTWHEIVNDTVGDVPVLVTFCPLCNSALTFDRRFGEQVFEFGTSGLLRNSDLIMYDRTTETLWQQFTGEGIVGELAGERLTFVPSALVSFDDFRAGFPEGLVLSRDTGLSRSYGENPYAGYDTIGRTPFLFDGELDGRLQAVSRVVTVSFVDVDVAYPYRVLSDSGVINDAPAGHELVVFWTAGTASALGAPTIANADDVGATGVFDPNLNGQKLTFVAEDGVIMDEQTGSVWNVLGQAIEGELAGESLTPIVHGDHFWFSWAAFRPDTIIFGQ